jgi:membrane fusion protein (multidrug efflux system)
MKKAFKIGIAALVIAVGATAGIRYWVKSSQVRATDNAYVNADIVQVASRENGQVAKVYVREGQLVNAGQVLFELDPAPFQVALSEAEAKLAEAEQSTREDKTTVSAEQAAVTQAEADLGSARNAYHRTHALVQQNYISKQAEDDALAKMKMAEAALEQAQAKLAGAKLHAAAVGAAPPAVLAAQAAVEQAKLDLEHTKVIASKDGWITNMTLVPGTTVTPNMPLFALVVRGSFWVDANFKETELPGIAVGQPADIRIDMLPGQGYHGVVEIIGNGTGAAFSLLPAQNATGNWVKVTQRIPVRIRFSGSDIMQPFRVGASARVDVHLKG